MTEHLIDTGDGFSVRVRTDGPVEEPTRPPLLLCNSLGTDSSMWDPQIEDWARRRQVIRFDHRGSAGTAPPPPYALERLGEDALAVLDGLAVTTADVCGLSLGGLIAQWLAINHPHRVRRAVFADTAPRIGSAEGWEARIAAVRTKGMEGIADMVLTRFFSPSFLTSGSTHISAVRRMVTATADDGYVGACEALAEADLTGELHRVAAPVLVIVGGADEATPPAQAAAMVDLLPNARLALIADAGHLANLEEPERFGALVSDFLDQ